MRKRMMDKRARKMNGLRITNPVLADTPHETPDLLIVGMGSVGGTIDEARERLAADGIRTNRLIVRQLHPFPVEEVLAAASGAKLIAVVENNSTGQLANQLKLHGVDAGKIRNVLKYNGNPFLPGEVYQECKGLV
jgi:2-oxoglutarate ferredoxin oxidoreductase subunit alpha